jgi:8-amino-7-oxononanoate synthase
LIQREPQRRRALRDNCARIRDGLARLGYRLGDSRSQILPLMIGDATACMDLSQHLLDKGVYAQGIRPPTVPQGTSRLRITLMATHTFDQIDRALETFASLNQAVEWNDFGLR